MKKYLYKKPLLLLWIVLAVFTTGFYYERLTGNDRTTFLPGAATDGHHQIISDCKFCHGDGFEDEKVLQKSCVSCHGPELKEAKDSHPMKKFRDPRNADRLEIINAMYCVTCHVEHKPERTGNMGVTMPEDFCILCHKDVAKKRKSHADMKFNSCDDAGCHNYHDNRALYEEYLVKHGNLPAQLPKQIVVEKTLNQYFTELDEKYRNSLTIDQQDSKLDQLNPKVFDQWQKSRHAATGVNCSSCHSKNNKWSNYADVKTCENCHELEVLGFKSGKHGMMLSATNATVTVANSRLNYKSKKNKDHLSCTSCHGDHKFNVDYAAIDACLNCHEDKHSKNFKKTKHYATWLNTKNGTLESTAGVTCATCHLPRKTVSQNGIERTLVQHNQNENLEPNEKMVRSVCMNCHGLRFSLESLADNELVKSNFNGVSKINNKGFEMALERELKKRAKKTEENNEG